MSLNRCDCGQLKSTQAKGCQSCKDTQRSLIVAGVLFGTREGRPAASLAADLEVTKRTIHRIRSSLRKEGRL